MDLAERIERYRATVEKWLRGLYHGMFTHPAYEKIEKEAEDLEDAFMLACFPDAFGIPSPVSYYTAELLAEFVTTRFQQGDVEPDETKPLRLLE